MPRYVITWESEYSIIIISCPKRTCMYSSRPGISTTLRLLRFGLMFPCLPEFFIVRNYKCLFVQRLFRRPLAVCMSFHRDYTWPRRTKLSSITPDTQATCTVVQCKYLIAMYSKHNVQVGWGELFEIGGLMHEVHDVRVYQMVNEKCHNDFGIRLCKILPLSKLNLQDDNITSTLPRNKNKCYKFITAE